MMHSVVQALQALGFGFYSVFHRAVFESGVWGMRCGIAYSDCVALCTVGFIITCPGYVLLSMQALSFCNALL